MQKDTALSIRLSNVLIDDVDSTRHALCETMGQVPSRSFVIRMALRVGLKELRKELND